MAAVAAQQVTWGKELAPVMRHGRLFTPGTDAGGGEFPMIPACACKNGYRRAAASGLVYAEGWALRPRRILVHAGWCLDGQAVVDPGFTEPAAAYFGVALDPDYMRRVQESDHDDDGNDIFMGVFHPDREMFGPLLDPASDIAGPVGRDIPASVRDWALTSESRRAPEAGPPGLDSGGAAPVQRCRRVLAVSDDPAGPGGPWHRRSPPNTRRNQRCTSPHAHGLNVYPLGLRHQGRRGRSHIQSACRGQASRVSTISGGLAGRAAVSA